jgi:hypothetical protein
VCSTLTSETGLILLLFGFCGVRRGVDEVFVLVGYYAEVICIYRNLEKAYRFHFVP